MKPRYIAHTGKKQPVADGVRVEVCFRGGKRNSGHPASAWGWGYSGGQFGIIAYRVIEQE